MTGFTIVTDQLNYPEGPVAMADGSVLLVEMAIPRLSRVRPGGAIEVVADLGGGPNGVAIGPDGAAYVCNNGGVGFTRAGDAWLAEGIPENYAGGSIQRVDLATGAVTTLYTACDGALLRGPNDIVFDSSGGFWFTDLGKVDDKVIDWGAVYYAKPDGSAINRVIPGLLTPNGIGLSPDGMTLYVAETFTSRLWRFPVVSPGQIRQGQDGMPGDEVGRAPCYDMFDSLAVEADGAVCVASLVRGGISLFNDAGRHEFVPLGAPSVTNICFGGPDMRDAWVTMSMPGRLYHTRWPRPGLKLAFNA